MLTWLCITGRFLNDNRFEKVLGKSVFSGGNSGAGSYNHLAEFKAAFLNGWIFRHNIRSVIDYGVGDGNQLTMLEIDHLDSYLGIDVSEYVVRSCRERFAVDKNKSFAMAEDISRDRPTAELAMSCDVLFHLIEDHVFLQYMDNLFAMAQRYVIIYARDEDVDHTPGRLTTASPHQCDT